MTLKRILYVEDEPLVQTIAKIALVKVGGFELRICSSGAQALDEVKDFAPQLILLDVVMPGMDGPATLQRLRQDADTAAIPVVFLTANSDQNEIAQYIASGALDVIAKPFNPMMLAEQVRQVWAKRPT
jgi:two-component system, OmpR family, response regulator